MSLQLQEIVRANIEHDEKSTQKIMDELLRLSLIVDGGEGKNFIGTDGSKLMSDDEIAAVVKDIDSSLGAIEVCRKHDLPLTVLFHLRARFKGMNASAIHRLRQLEDEHTVLTQRVETLLIENQRLTGTKTRHE